MATARVPVNINFATKEELMTLPGVSGRECDALQEWNR